MIAFYVAKLNCVCETYSLTALSNSIRPQIYAPYVCILMALHQQDCKRESVQFNTMQKTRIKNTDTYRGRNKHEMVVCCRRQAQEPMEMKEIIILYLAKLIDACMYSLL